jgi:glycosyltransferase involved in cell wall biosynthesis
MFQGDFFVSVCMITYNHEAFIEKAIQGVLAQKANFAFELVIGEDSSCDRTRSICEYYVRLYPGRIRLLPSVARKGMSLNFLDTIRQCAGKYIAFCEGDDFWIDENKLQMQVDFLESNMEYVLSCTNYKTYDTKLKRYMDQGPLKYVTDLSGESFDLEGAVFHWLTKTLTVVYRRSSFDPDDLPNYQLFRDVHLVFHLLCKGNGYLHYSTTGVYNMHDAGSWSPLSLKSKASVSYRVFEDLYTFNSSNPIIRNRFLLSLRDYLNVSIDTSPNPLFDADVYRLIKVYVREIYSLPFLRDCLKRIFKSQFR